MQYMFYYLKETLPLTDNNKVTITAWLEQKKGQRKKQEAYSFDRMFLIRRCIVFLFVTLAEVDYAKLTAPNVALAQPAGTSVSLCCV